MLRKTPLKNSKNVNKPFQSPFDPARLGKKSENTDSPVSTRHVLVKKNLLLSQKQKENVSKTSEEPEERPSNKDESQNGPVLVTKNVELNPKQKENFLKTSEEPEESPSNEDDSQNGNEPPSKRRRTNNCETVVVNTSIANKQFHKPALLALKRRIFEKRQELDCLKSRSRSVKKHNPEVLKASIKKWKSACQNALEELCSELNKQNGDITSRISDVLTMLNIPETLVGYSKENDTFNS